MAFAAGRLRLAQQSLTESLLLSLAGGVAGLLVAKWGVKLLVALSPPGLLRIDESGPFSLSDGRVLGFICAVVALVGLLAGLFPALQASKVAVNETLKTQSDRRSRRNSGLRALPALMIAEFALALVLLVGIYGVISYAVSRRTHEIGIRMALGAQARDVLRMVIWRGISLALIGVALGLAAALALTLVMKNLLFEVSATDPATFALIALLLVGVALIAS